MCRTYEAMRTNVSIYVTLAFKQVLYFSMAQAKDIIRDVQWY